VYGVYKLLQVRKSIVAWNYNGEKGGFF